MKGYTDLTDYAFMRTDIEVVATFNVVQMKTAFAEEMFYIAKGPIIESSRHNLCEHSFAKGMYLYW